MIQIGHDPLFSRYPIRGFAVDLGLAGAPRLTLARWPRPSRAAWTPSPWRRGASAGRPSTGRSRGRRDAGTAVRGDTPIDMAWLSRCIGDVDRRQHDRRQRVRSRHHPDQAADARQLLQPVPGLRPRLGARRRAGGQAGRARQDRRLLRRRRRLHLRRADRGPLGGPRPQPARAQRDLQQPRLERRQALGHLPRAPGLGGAHRHHGDERARAGARLRDDRARLGGHGERVEDRAALPRVVRRALRVVREDKRQALLNVICKKP